MFHLTAQDKKKKWTKHTAKKWFHDGKWLQGLSLQPDKTVNVLEFAKQYHLNKSYWDAAFSFLKNQVLEKIQKGKYPIDGDNVYASVTEDPSKDFDKTNWESHKKYIDIQCVLTGKEMIGICDTAAAKVTKEYDEKKDVMNYSAEGKQYPATPGKFFLFFPSDVHRPNITPGGNKVVKKIVIKVRVA